MDPPAAVTELAQKRWNCIRGRGMGLVEFCKGPVAHDSRTLPKSARIKRFQRSSFLASPLRRLHDCRCKHESHPPTRGGTDDPPTPALFGTANLGRPLSGCRIERFRRTAHPRGRTGGTRSGCSKRPPRRRSAPAGVRGHIERSSHFDVGCRRSFLLETLTNFVCDRVANGPFANTTCM